MNQTLKIVYRENVVPADVAIVIDIVKSTGFFNQDEIDIAIELVEDRLSIGISSGYYFLFAEIDGQVVAYSCYGPIQGTQGSFDIYWIATHNNHRGKGIGKILLKETEKRIIQAKGINIFVETASKPQYESTRKFYEKTGYALEARISQFYADDDDKLIYKKRI